MPSDLFLDGGSFGSSYRPTRAPTKAAPSSRKAPTPRPSPPSMPPRMGTGPIPSITQTAPKPQNIKGYLAGDEVYQQALRGGKRSLQDFLSELARRRTETGVNFEQTKGQLELDRTRQLEQMRDEFASRGLIHSGLFAEKQGDFQEDFKRRLDQLGTSNSQILADILGQETNYRREQELALEAARQEALARRAAQFGLV